MSGPDADFGFDQPIERRGTRSIKWSQGEADGAWIDTAPPSGAGTQDAALLPMWLADMDFATAPAVREALRTRVDHGVFGYTLLGQPLLEAITSWMERRHGWSVASEWIVTNSGVMPAINLLIQTLSAPGDGVIVQPPVFHPISEAVTNNGRRLRSNPLQYVAGGYRMDLAGLEELAAEPATRMFILCSPHNPVGRVWRHSELVAVADICERHDVLVVSDEIHGDLTYPWADFVSTGSIAVLHDRLIVCMGASKAFNLPGLKTSLTIIPSTEIREAFLMTLHKQNELFGANLFGVTALEAAYTAGEPWLDALLDYLAGNIDYVAGFLADRLPQLRLVRPEALYLLWIDCRELGLTGPDLDARLRAAGLWLEHGATYGEEGEGFVRMTIACPRSAVEEGMERFARAVATK